LWISSYEDLRALQALRLKLRQTT